VTWKIVCSPRLQPRKCQQRASHKSQVLCWFKLRSLTRSFTHAAVIPGALAFSVHLSDEITRKRIEDYPNLFFFSSDYPEHYEPFCADFGPVNLGVRKSHPTSPRWRPEHLRSTNTLEPFRGSCLQWLQGPGPRAPRESRLEIDLESRSPSRASPHELCSTRCPGAASRAEIIHQVDTMAFDSLWLCYSSECKIMPKCATCIRAAAAMIEISLFPTGLEPFLLHDEGAQE